MVLRMEAQHERVAATLATIDTAISAWVVAAGQTERDALVAAVVEHRDPDWPARNPRLFHNVLWFMLHLPSPLAGDGDAGLVRDHDELRAVATVQLVEQPADVGLDRGHGQI